jgi:hypothetical protein
VGDNSYAISWNLSSLSWQFRGTLVTLYTGNSPSMALWCFSSRPAVQILHSEVYTLPTQVLAEGLLRQGCNLLRSHFRDCFTGSHIL